MVDARCPESHIGLMLVGSLMLVPGLAWSEFELNFQPNYANRIPGSDSAIRTIYWNSDNPWGTPGGVQTGSLGTPEQTPYLQDNNSLERPEIVVDAQGNYYYHMIVGALSDGFIQETYIQFGFIEYGNPSEPSSPAFSGSASAGSGDYNSVTTFGNGYDPLDMDANETAKLVESGNGTANPKRVIVRQLYSDGELFMEFHKDTFATKPRLTQLFMGPDIMMQFEIDMRGIDYDTDDVDAPIINTMQLFGEGVPPESAKFDMVNNTQDVRVSAGKYIYTDGSGPGGAEGTYSYADGDYKHTEIDWAEYFDVNTYNPWAFESGKSQ